jgi:hypothetical protein
MQRIRSEFFKKFQELFENLAGLFSDQGRVSDRAGHYQPVEKRGLDLSHVGNLAKNVVRAGAM